MSGHNKWSQIKHKKAATDIKRAKQFTKLLATVQAAAKTDPNPSFNPRLRSAILKAKESNIPQENIDRAINKAKSNPTEELVIEAYGPSGTAFMIKALTDNKNRTVAEIRKLLSDNSAKFAEQGSVKWMFDADKNGEWAPNFKQAVSKANSDKIAILTEKLNDHPDVAGIYTNASMPE